MSVTHPEGDGQIREDASDIALLEAIGDFDTHLVTAGADVDRRFEVLLGQLRPVLVRQIIRYEQDHGPLTTLGLFASTATILLQFVQMFADLETTELAAASTGADRVDPDDAEDDLPY